MPYRIEIALKPELMDAEGSSLCKKAGDYFGLELGAVRTVNIVTIDAGLSREQVELVRKEIFTNPVTQWSCLEPLPIDFDWCIWVGFRPGVKDNAGDTAAEAMADLLRVGFGDNDAVYTSKRFCVKGDGLDAATMEMLAAELLANDIIQQWRIYSKESWDDKQGIGIILPKVRLDHRPTVTTIAIDSDRTLRRISDQRNLALNPADIPTIRSYFLNEQVRLQRSKVGLADPTDVELEYISQARSDHCNHNTFRGKFFYRDLTSGKEEIVDNLFKTCIEAPTLKLKQHKPWVISVLWDNAGAARFDDDHYYVVTGETHNSPSNMEAYGGAITGIVGIYRDPMGTGKGARLIMGSYGFCVGPRDYAGCLRPRLHPRRLLDGVIEGVRDGGNKSGIPTPFGNVLFHPGYMGKCLVFVTALGIMPSRIQGEPAEQKTILPGDLVIMCGGRVGKDGIHGVTASSESFSEHTPAGHVQIGDPYTQKKMHDFLLESRDQGLIRFITDNGGGGLSSSVGESARFSNGCHIELEKVPLKYEGLDQWEIWISESQERMTVAVAPENRERFLELAAKHAVEATVIGTYNDSGKLHITYEGRTCAYVDLDLLTAGFPQWQFEAHWTAPAQRGLTEPVISCPLDFNRLMLDIMAAPNICSKEWIARQYDHEVQGTSVIKPLVGVRRNVPSDAAVLRPVLESEKGLAFAQALLPHYSKIDAFHMTACVIDEAVRRVIAVGADPERIGGVDNFCWPNIQYHPETNPDGRFKAAQLVRSCKALRRICLDYGIPLLSGKDSMYVDGHLPAGYGERHKISALETLQFSTTGIVDKVELCVTMEAKLPGDRIYILGLTGDELGASEYYDFLGYTGLNIPRVDTGAFMKLYRALYKAICNQLVASVHGIYRGGLGVHLALVAMAGNLGMEIDLTGVPCNEKLREDRLLFSESAGRFIVTVADDAAQRFETCFAGLPLGLVGTVKEQPCLEISGGDGKRLIQLDLDRLERAWKGTFGHLV